MIEGEDENGVWIRVDTWLEVGGELLPTRCLPH